jgi:hypothetical protein
MRLSSNDKLIERQSKIARYATFGGLAVLLGSLVISFNNQNIVLAYAALAIGFFLAMVGSTLANKWIKEPRADKALEKALKGFDNKHHLLNYLLPAEHVLITPTGLLVFKVKRQDGTITYQNGKWKYPWRISRLIGGLGAEPLGNPIDEMNAEISAMRKFLTDKVENAALIPIDGYVVFTDPRAQLSIDDASLPVVKTDDLKETLRKSKRGTPLSSQVLGQLERALKPVPDAKTTDE